MVGIVRVIVGLVTFFIAVAIAKVLLGILGFALHLIWLLSSTLGS